MKKQLSLGMFELSTSWILDAAFLDCAISRDDFLMECGGGDNESEEDISPLFFGSFYYESELSSISCLRCFV